MTMTPERLARLDGPGWVTGSFISDVLVARVERHITMHTFAEQANGWRWNIVQQDWCQSCAWKITSEQELRVIDWLEAEGWMDVEEATKLRARVW